MTQEWYQHYEKQQMSAQYLKKGKGKSLNQSTTDQYR